MKKTTQQIIAIILLLIQRLIMEYEVPYEEYDPSMCKALFLFNILLAYFVKDAWSKEAEDRGTLWQILFGMVVLNGMGGLYAWAIPAMIPFLIYCIGFGIIMGFHLNVMVPADRVSRFLHRQISMEKLDKIFDPKKKEDNHE